jgi:hypothetical protein
MIRIKWQALYHPLLTLLFLLLLLAAGEALVRLHVFTARIMAPTLNTTHRQFEVQWQRLQDFAREKGRVDCIFLGNSMVVSGFDPLAFAAAYAAQTGEPLQCFNFGVDGIPAATAGALAKILMDQYQPRLLIYGIAARDMSVLRSDPDTTVLLDLPWLQNRLGNYNLEGWLLDHSALYRSRRLLLNLSRFTFRDTLRSYYGTETPAAYLGYDPVTEVAAEVATPPDPQSSVHLVQYYYGLLEDYKMQQENKAGLDMLLAQQRAPGQILVLEMPVPPTYFDFFTDPAAEYGAFLDYVQNATAQRGVPFWRAAPSDLIPAAGWKDYAHMNAAGAAVFSAWLGRKVAEDVQFSKLAPATEVTP